MHAEKVIKELNLKNLCISHDLYVQSDTLLLADAFENFRNMCIEIFELEHAHSLSAPGLASQACLEKARVKLELLTDIDMPMIVEKGIRGGICHAIHKYLKANNKYMKNYDKDMELPYLKYLGAKNLYGWAISKNSSVNGFEWVEDLSQFKEDFI